MREVNTELFVNQMNEIIAAVERGEVGPCSEQSKTSTEDDQQQEATHTHTHTHKANLSVDSGVQASGESGNEV